MYQATHEVPSASAQEPVSHHHVMWLVKEWYSGAFWYREAIRFREQLEKQYMNGIGIAHGELIWKGRIIPRPFITTRTISRRRHGRKPGIGTKIEYM